MGPSRCSTYGCNRLSRGVSAWFHTHQPSDLRLLAFGSQVARGPSMFCERLPYGQQNHNKRAAHNLVDRAMHFFGYHLPQHFKPRCIRKTFFDKQGTIAFGAKVVSPGGVLPNPVRQLELIMGASVLKISFFKYLHICASSKSVIAALLSIRLKIDDQKVWNSMSLGSQAEN